MKGKTLLCLALVTSMLLGVFMVGPVGAQSTTIGVEPIDTIDPGLGTGSTFTVEIWIREIVDLAGVEFKLGYNTTVLTATTITYGGIFGVDYFPLISDIDDTEGYLVYGFMEAMGDPSFNGSGRAAIIDFTVDSYGDCALDLYDTKLGDSAAPPVPISHGVLDGYFSNIHIFLHAQAGLINISDPEGTRWHELYPTYSNRYNLTFWADMDHGGDLTYCDYIKMKNLTDGAAVDWYHVYKVTVTINTTSAPTTITRSPSSTSGGWTNGAGAHADGGTSASITSATPSASQYYSAYGFNIPADATIVQVRVRLDALTEPDSLWISCGGDWIYKVETADPTTAIKSWDSGTGSPFGVEWYDGYVYYVDYSADYLYKMTEDGGSVASWDIVGFSGDAYGLGVNGTHFAIADRSDDAIYIVSVDEPGTLLQTISDSFGYAEGVCWKDGYWYVVDSGDDDVKKFTPAGSYVQSYSLDSAIGSGSGITWDGTYWWISDDGDNLVYKLTQSDLEGGTYTTSYNTPASDDQGLSFVPAGDEYIYLKVSNDGATTWLPSEWYTELTETETTYWVNVTDWTDWTPANINSDNIQAQVWAYTKTTKASDVYLDWIPIEVKYTLPMYIEFDDPRRRVNIQDFNWSNPVSTWWHEIRQVFSNRYNLTGWTDNSPTNLTVCDDIQLNGTTYHVDGISTDIIVKKLPSPPDIPEFPLETILPIALIIAVIYVWWIKKPKRNTRQQKPTSTISHPH